MLLYVSDITDGDSYISRYSCPEPNTKSAVQVASVSGFCTPECILHAINDLRCVCCCTLEFCPVCKISCSWQYKHV